MDESLQKAENLLKSHGHSVIFITNTKNSGMFKISEIISITESKFIILSQNGGKIKQTYSFLDFLSLTIDKNKITLCFDKASFSFESSESVRIAQIIQDVVQHVLTMNEQRKVKINGFKVVKTEQNGIAALARLKENCQNPNDCNNQDIGLLYNVLVYSQPSVNILNFSNPIQFSKQLVKILPFCPNIKYLTIPSIKELDPYSLLLPFTKNNFFLKHISINGEITSSYPEFISSLNENHDSKLFGLSFSYSNMTSEELDILYNYAVNRNLHGLGFHRAIKSHAMNYFYSTFLTQKLFQSIFLLDLSNTGNINIQKLLPKLTTIEFLSLNNCGIDIKDVLFNISSFSKLRVLDIGHNTCTTKLTDKIVQLPTTLNTLIVDNVSFSAGCIIPFFSFIFSHFENGIRFSISSIVTSNDEWKPLFDFFYNSTFKSFVSLTWDSNPVNSKFFTFLVRSVYLESLSLNSCFKSSSSDSLKSLSLFIQSAENLKELSIRGSKHNFIGNNLNTLLKMIRSSESLESLDITYSKCGDNGLKQICDFLSSETKINQLIMDGTETTSSEALKEFLQIADRLKDKIKISFPANDIDRLIKKGELTEEEAASIRDNFRVQNNSNSDSYFLQPFNVFRYFHMDSFPLYLSKSEVEEIRSIESLIPNSPIGRSPLGSPRGKEVDIFRKKKQNYYDISRTPLSSNLKEFLDPDDGSKRITKKPQKKEEPPFENHVKPIIRQRKRPTTSHRPKSRVSTKREKENEAAHPREKKNDTSKSPEKKNESNHSPEKKNYINPGSVSKTTRKPPRATTPQEKSKPLQKEKIIEERNVDIDKNSQNSRKEQQVPATTIKPKKALKKKSLKHPPPRPSSQLARRRPRVQSEKLYRSPSPIDTHSVRSAQDDIEITYQPIDWEFPDISSKNKTNEFWKSLKLKFRVDEIIGSLVFD